MHALPRTTVTLAALSCALFAASGCGSSSESTESTHALADTPTVAEPSSGGADAGDRGSAKETTRPHLETEAQSPERGGRRGPSEGPPGGEPAGGEYKPDTSLQTFGSEVGGPLEKEVAGAVLAFFRALAKPSYPGICSRIARANREQILEYAEVKSVPGKSCPAVLASVLPPPNRQIKRSVESTITHVRVKKRETIVFFRPPGGEVSYIPMVRQGGKWKSVTLVPGTPVKLVMGRG